MAKGGYRPGAGKKKGYKAPHTLEAQEARKVFIEKVHESIIPIVESLLRKASEGDVPAIKELLNRSWGQAPQSLTFDGTIEDKSKHIDESARAAAAKAYAEALKHART